MQKSLKYELRTPVSYAHFLRQTPEGVHKLLKDGIQVQMPKAEAASLCNVPIGDLAELQERVDISYETLDETVVLPLQDYFTLVLLGPLLQSHLPLSKLREIRYLFNNDLTETYHAKIYR